MELTVATVASLTSIVGPIVGGIAFSIFFFFRALAQVKKETLHAINNTKHEQDIARTQMRDSLTASIETVKVAIDTMKDSFVRKADMDRLEQRLLDGQRDLKDSIEKMNDRVARVVEIIAQGKKPA